MSISTSNSPPGPDARRRQLDHPAGRRIPPGRLRRMRRPMAVVALPIGVCLLAAGLGPPAGSGTPARGTISPDALAAMHQSFDEVQEEKYDWGWIRWLMNDKLDPGCGMTFGVVQIDAGQRNPAHVHPNCEELLYVLSGSCEHRIGSQTAVLKPGDLLRIPAGVSHAARALGTEPMKAVVVYNTGARQFVPVDESGS